MKCPHCQNDAPDTNYRCPHCGIVLEKKFDPLDFYRKPRKKSSVSLIQLLVIVLVLGAAALGYFLIQQNKKTAPPLEISEKKVTAIQETTPAQPDDLKDNTTEGESRQEQVQQLDRSEEPAESNEDEQFGSSDKQTEDEYDQDASFDDMPTISHTAGEEVDVEELVYKGKVTIFDFYSEYCGPCRRMSPKLERLDEKRDDIVVVKIDINRENVRGIDWGSPVSRQYNLRSIPYFIIYDTSGRRTHEGYAAIQWVNRILYDEGIQ